MPSGSNDEKLQAFALKLADNNANKSSFRIDEKGVIAVTGHNLYYVSYTYRSAGTSFTSQSFQSFLEERTGTYVAVSLMVIGGALSESDGNTLGKFVSYMRLATD